MSTMWLSIFDSAVTHDISFSKSLCASPWVRGKIAFRYFFPNRETIRRRPTNSIRSNSENPILDGNYEREFYKVYNFADEPFSLSLLFALIKQNFMVPADPMLTTVDAIISKNAIKYLGPCSVGKKYGDQMFPSVMLAHALVVSF